MPVNAQTLQPGWLEFDPECMVTSVIKCIDATIENLEKLDIDASDIVAIGIASQRCTAIAWDKTTDRLIYPACIMAADVRTKPMIEQLTKVKLGKGIISFSRNQTALRQRSFQFI